jgi:putative DNA primase/helicase
MTAATSKPLDDNDRARDGSLPFDPFGSTVEPPPSAVTPPAASSAELTHCLETDTANAERLIADHGDDVRFVSTWGTWCTWTGTCWAEDSSGVRMSALAKTTARRIYEEAARLENDSERAARGKWARASETRSRREAMISLARSEPGVAISHDLFDRAPMLLNVANGTIDLSTGEPRAHRREDMLTRCLDVAFDANATCPTWTASLDRVCGDAKLVGALRRAIGYSLTGDVSEQSLFFMYGPGANMKSTIARVLQSVLGAYAVQAPADLLFRKAHGDGHPCDLASLYGARVALCTETEADARLAEVRVKALTGGDVVSCRRMHENYWQYTPTHKLWISGNHRPRITGTDEAIWRRVHLLPFTVTIPESERDPHLLEKLLEERAGILAWAVRGCLEWQDAGLAMPACVRDATKAYRTSEDTVARFVDDECDRDDGARSTSRVLYDAFSLWAKRGGEPPMTSVAFGRALSSAGFGEWRGKKGRGFAGLRLRALDGGVTDGDGCEAVSPSFFDKDNSRGGNRENGSHPSPSVTPTTEPPS